MKAAKNIDELARHFASGTPVLISAALWAKAFRRLGPHTGRRLRSGSFVVQKWRRVSGKLQG